MNDELFSIEQHLSPREAWKREIIERLGISVTHTPELPSKQWHAYTGEWNPRRYPLFPLPGEEIYYAEHARAHTEFDAIEMLARKLGQKTWREALT